MQHDAPSSGQLSEIERRRRLPNLHAIDLHALCTKNGVGEARYANCAVSYLRAAGGGRRAARGQVPSAGKARFRDEDGSLRDSPNDNSAIRSGRVALRKNFHTEDGWRRG